MIVETVQGVVNEVNGLWSWMMGIIAGWGLTFTIVIVAIIVLFIRSARLNKKIIQLENRIITNDRDTSLRLTNLEK